MKLAQSLWAGMGPKGDREVAWDRWAEHGVGLCSCGCGARAVSWWAGQTKAAIAASAQPEPQAALDHPVSTCDQPPLSTRT